MQNKSGDDDDDSNIHLPYHRGSGLRWRQAHVPMVKSKVVVITKQTLSIKTSNLLTPNLPG